ncbi:lysine/ornithine N-monooxygenase [Achromobacter deleyi]|uniref:lysine N(6)-hydroxylase/L-ornithine N(5)-oxygenase family protein n=1 Tax=Achromobacter TaxID=222 RepID=UPI000CFC320C|nr:MULTISPECIES: lysine N(6)-hydroxylase/L-ornithine N(5)-oxygenase family protein [Achromobacter]MDR6599846.1 lysine/ornithine N-monooxygenase [Achromobacter deleyi]PQZ64396.1 ornithine monooxygenase [Achromobacter sp. MYb9]
MQVHDLIGIGFGPSNIALAIALEERYGGDSGLLPLFLEKQPCFAWHPHMMLDGTHMQISFLKDLVTLRNPASPFTFLNYLHSQGRLQQFINLKTFFPSRHEFNDYLAWAAGHFSDRCAYGEDVFEVAPEAVGDTVPLLRVRSRDAQGRVRERLARNLVVSVGGKANVPEPFLAWRDEPRIFHTSSYLSAIGKITRPRRIAVLGAGQSAAEIFMNLHEHPDRPQVDLLMRGRALRPSDDSPYMNEIFNAEHTDYIYSRPPAERAGLLSEAWHTNYSAPDVELIERIYNVFYQQQVTRQARHQLRRRCQVDAVEVVDGADGDDQGVALTLFDRDTHRSEVVRYDAVILATGYVRDHHKQLLAPLAPYLEDHAIDRHYRLRADARLKPAIYVQGGSETTHGISDSLLSILAIRSQEIGNALRAGNPGDAVERPQRERPAALAS